MMLQRPNIALIGFGSDLKVITQPLKPERWYLGVILGPTCVSRPPSCSTWVLKLNVVQGGMHKYQEACVGVMSQRGGLGISPRLAHVYKCSQSQH